MFMWSKYKRYIKQLEILYFHNKIISNAKTYFNMVDITVRNKFDILL